jgi:hypothetical protein
LISKFFSLVVVPCGKLNLNMKKFFTLLLLFFSITSFCQDTAMAAVDSISGGYPEASKESQAYHNYRMQNTDPVYNVVKIKKLIKGIQQKEADDDIVLNNKLYNALSTKEKFSYCMLHAESFSQSCADFPPIQEEQYKIMANLEDGFDPYAWSSRQNQFLKTNKDSVISWLKESIVKRNRIGLNFKIAIVEINAFTMIPFLIQHYQKNNNKDLDILTVLMNLLKENKYSPFLKSKIYNKLYGDRESYQAFIPFTKENNAFILKTADAFYQSKK